MFTMLWFMLAIFDLLLSVGLIKKWRISYREIWYETENDWVFGDVKLL